MACCHNEDITDVHPEKKKKKRGKKRKKHPGRGGGGGGEKKTQANTSISSVAILRE